MALRRSITEGMLSVADLRNLRSAVLDALESLKESSLPTDLKAFVSMHLVRIRTALDEYEYRGLVGLQEALAGYLGSLGLTSEQINTHADAPQKRKLSEVLSAANATITLAHGLAPLWPLLQTGASMITSLLGS